MNSKPLLETLFAALLFCCSSSVFSQSTSSWHNDLDGGIRAQIEFAQTHVIGARRDIFDPLLVPHREALVIFKPSPLVVLVSASMVLELNGTEYVIPLAPPGQFPRNAVFDQSNTFSGKPIIGDYPKYRINAWTATIPYYLFEAGMNLKFFVNGKPDIVGVLDRSKMIFLTSESEGLVLMNIKGCVFRDRNTCRTDLEQFDMQKNPELATIAAREMFSELPVQKLVLGMGEGYWPYIIALGPDGKPHRYSLSDRDYHEWAVYGDQTLPAKVGMGNFWRAASDLGDKQPGKFVGITGQLLDAPDDVPVLPPDVGASCGGNSCNYPQTPVGFWHETGHALRLPHWTPPRYEKWAYRSYDMRFLPNYHPAPHDYGLNVDYLGYHYFGHVVGTLTEPEWPDSVASAPLVDEFELLRTSDPSATTDWRQYIAPYTHQQMLQVQQRFGSFPSDLQFAAIGDDHRPPRPEALHAKDRPGREPTALIDAGIDTDSHFLGELLNLIASGQAPLETGVPVQTLVVTMAAAVHDSEQVSQIYPPIVSNYGNVFQASSAGADTVEGQLAALDSPQAITLFKLQVNYADGSADMRTLYVGSLPSYRLLTAAINVPVSRRPVSAELFRFENSVDKRDLSNEAALPPPIRVGTESGYPVIIPQFLRSKATGNCLARTFSGLKQKACNAGDIEQQWGLTDVLTPGDVKFVLTGPSTAKCLDESLSMKLCSINDPRFQWSGRTDLAQPEYMLLQSTFDGLFITASTDGTVGSSAFSRNDDQNFLRTPLDNLSP
ncbi:MAG: TagA-related metallopeptidase [Pseudomonas sp.]|nr:TagA-related metallopeptidase [Pseudomonas sp.]